MIGNDPRCTAALILAGADVNAVCARKRNALQYAVERYYEAIVDELLLAPTLSVASLEKALKSTPTTELEMRSRLELEVRYPLVTLAS